MSDADDQNAAPSWAQRGPYRVGMARAQQRYIEPDRIYTDMARGERTRIPSEFGFTWNPVNGYAPAQVHGVAEDLFNAAINAGRGVVDEGTKKVTGDVKDTLSKGAEDFLNSTPGKQVLDAVKAKAAEGVTDVVKKQAPNLIMLAVAGGAVGGALSAKLGKTGTVLALGVAGWAVMQLLKAGDELKAK